jgi:hypothetical protein
LHFLQRQQHNHMFQVFLLHPYKLHALYLCCVLKRFNVDSNTFFIIRQAAWCNYCIYALRLTLKGFSICLSLPAGSPVNGSMYSFSVIWSYSKSSCNCFRIYSWIPPLIFSTVGEPILIISKEVFT